MKSLLKKALVAVLGGQVRRLRKKYDFKIIGVVGSIGKTSTKLAIAKILSSHFRVRYQEGNYNEISSVPLVFFGQKMPAPWNILAWVKVIASSEAQIYKEYPFDIVVVELGIDGPGQMIQFKKYLEMDLAVVTAIAPEHMEFFKDLKDVAEEEWSVRFLSRKVFANRDLCQVLPADFDRNQVEFYGRELPGYEFDAFSLAQIYSMNAAVAVAKFFKVPEDKIKKAAAGIKSFSGRMQRLRGIKNSLIIDDTYNSSPSAAKMALDTLYAQPAKQRIAILGMMNELGATSEREHREIGKHCDPKFLDLVVTIGKDANSFLAKSAEERGCEVYRAKDAVDAGGFVKGRIRENAIILAKGSQNGVFAEEALKPLLADPADSVKLVRQDEYWLKKKSYAQG